jgi:cation diffusion facilitator family transporter
MPDAAPHSEQKESLRTVLVALGANLGIAAAKLVVALLTGSSAMLAESFHAAADCGNQGLLLVAQKHGQRPADERHPLGHGRVAYFWALIASLAVFVTGALFSVRQGLEELIHPNRASSFGIAYVTLLISFCLESLSLRRAYRQIASEGRTLRRDFLEHLDLTSDPIARAVFAEDAAAVIGNVIAAVGIALHQLTGSAIPDGIAALSIGLILGLVAYQLASRNADFLIGRQASIAIRGRIGAIISAQPGVATIEELVVTFLGPRQLWIVARVDLDETLSGGRVKQLLRQLEDALKGDSPFIARVDLVPSGKRGVRQQQSSPGGTGSAASL